MAVGFGVLSTATVHTGYPLLMVASMVVAAGMGLAMAPATESIMGSLPRAQAGVGSAVNDTTRFVGGALGRGPHGLGRLLGLRQPPAPRAHPRAGARYVAEAKSSVGAPSPSGSTPLGPSATHRRHRPPGVRGRFGPGHARRHRGRCPWLAGRRPVPARPRRIACP